MNILKKFGNFLPETAMKMRRMLIVRIFLWRKTMTNMTNELATTDTTTVERKIGLKYFCVTLINFLPLIKWVS